MRPIALFLLAFAILLFPVGEAVSGEMRVETVTIVTDKGSFDFRTEIAETEPQRRKGLMDRRSMPDDHAMLFDWGETTVAAMWMANTYISLDMLFIAADGTIVFIARNTTPHSRDIITARIPVAAVLELTAGTGDRIGLKVGDRAHHRLFRPAE